jgi:hypothetical protein
MSVPAEPLNVHNFLLSVKFINPPVAGKEALLEVCLG